MPIDVPLILTYVFSWAICCLILFPIVVRIILIFNYKKLSGCWYVYKTKNRIGQVIVPFDKLATFIKKRSGSPANYSSFEHLIRAFSLLEPGELYTVHTHLLPHLQRQEQRGKIKIITCTPHRKRFVREYISTHGYRWYFRNRMKKNAKNNVKLYKQFYNITFRKL